MNKDKVNEFSEVTQASEGDARKYLERANGDLQLAVAMFLAEQPETGPVHSSLGGGVNTRSQSTPQFPPISNSQPMSSSSSKSSLHRAPRHRFATFSDLNRESEAHVPSPFGDDDPAQFFTGGERSGLAVTNPNDRRGVPGGRGNNSDAGNLVEEIIKKAQQRAAKGETDSEEPADQRTPQQRFVGKGFRLGTEVDDEDALANADDDDFDEDNDEDNQTVIQRTMYFWRDGFSIDDGPLYRFDDPHNAIYLRAINMGRAPIELLKVNPHQPVDVKLVQRPDEDYVKPNVPPSLDNSGPGQRLGSATTVVTTSPPASARSASPQQPTTNNTLGQEGNATIQLRLADGTTRRLRFDGQGAVQQLYDYVDIESPSIGRPYVLQTPMPPRRLEDKQQSLESAGVVSAVVVQRWL